MVAPHPQAIPLAVPPSRSRLHPASESSASHPPGAHPFLHPSIPASIHPSISASICTAFPPSNPAAIPGPATPQAGLTRVPEFGYDLQLSVASAALVPLIRQWLDGAVRDLVLQARGGEGGGAAACSRRRVVLAGPLPCLRGRVWPRLTCSPHLQATHSTCTHSTPKCLCFPACLPACPPACLQPWVLPEHYFLPIDPGVRDVERPAGVLAVRVLGAENVSGGAPRPRRKWGCPRRARLHALCCCFIAPAGQLARGA